MVHFHLVYWRPHEADLSGRAAHCVEDKIRLSVVCRRENLEKTLLTLWIDYHLFPLHIFFSSPSFSFTSHCFRLYLLYLAKSIFGIKKRQQQCNHLSIDSGQFLQRRRNVAPLYNRLILGSFRPFLAVASTPIAAFDPY